MVSASGFIPQAVLYCCVVLLCVFPCGISVWFILCGTADLLCGTVVWYCVVLVCGTYYCVILPCSTDVWYCCVELLCGIAAWYYCVVLP